MDRTRQANVTTTAPCGIRAGLTTANQNARQQPPPPKAGDSRLTHVAGWRIATAPIAPRIATVIASARLAAYPQAF